MKIIVRLPQKHVESLERRFSSLFAIYYGNVWIKISNIEQKIREESSTVFNSKASDFL